MFRKLGLIGILAVIIASIQVAACPNFKKTERLSIGENGQIVTEVQYTEVENSEKCTKIDKSLSLANNGLQSRGIRDRKLSYAKVTQFLANEYQGQVNNIYIGPALDGRDGLSFNGFDSIIKFEYLKLNSKISNEAFFIQCDIRIYSNNSNYGTISNCNFEESEGANFEAPYFNDLSFNLDEISENISIKNY